MKKSLLLSLVVAMSSLAGPLEDKDRPVANTAALSAAESAGKMKLPPGFSVQVVAAEPDVVQPVAYTMDDRGRLWVLENTNYPNCPGEKKDKILIFEDFGPDGKAQKRTVFFDKMTFATGIAVGHGGVWVGAPPNLIFIPRNGDEDKPAGEPQIVLDGWGNDDTHETLNDFIWGPDGWLYGTQGIFTNSKVGKPGAPESERVGINGGVWRYHPTKKKFELYAEGASNQWGVDWDDRGQAYFEACVIPHMWQCIQGARYQRQAGQHFNKFTYEDIRTIADFEYEKRAYCGAMVYLGGQWPQEFRDTFFFHDIHMNKMRNEKLTRVGSGMKAEKHMDFLVSEDAWFRGLSPQYGPDGSVFVNDWYDRVPCHQQREFTDRSNGRIYKVVYQGAKSVNVDLQKASDEELVKMQLDQNDWYVRHARRILAERGPKPGVQAALEKILRENADETRKLRALWALHGTRSLTESTALEALRSPMEYVRAWTTQLVCEEGAPTAAELTAFSKMAVDDASPVVRLYLASAANRIEITKRWPILEGLASHAEDAKDHNLPLMLWYAAEPAVGADIVKGAELLASGQIPKVQEFTARRIATLEAAPDRLGVLVRTLGKVGTPEAQASILRGLNAALKGKRDLAVPPGWAELYEKLKASPSEGVRQEAQALAAIFGGGAALDEMRKTLSDAGAGAEARKGALDSLLSAKDAATLPLLLDLATQAGPLRAAVLRGLAGYDDTRIPAKILAVFPKLETADRSDAINTLLARPASARALLAAIDAKTLDRSAIGAPAARQLQSLRDPGIDAWVAKNWGAVRTSSADKQKEIAKYKEFLGTDAVLRANASHGRVLFTQRCAICHTLFGEGAKIGPELPGSFADLDYLLQNILDPNATIGKDYQQTFVKTKDGQTLNGIVAADDASSVTLKTFAGPVTVQRTDIASIEVSPNSLMPEGLLLGVDEESVRDLFLYLRQKQQVPLPTSAP